MNRYALIFPVLCSVTIYAADKFSADEQAQSYIAEHNNCSGGMLIDELANIIKYY